MTSHIRKLRFIVRRTGIFSYALFKFQENGITKECHLPSSLSPELREECESLMRKKRYRVIGTHKVRHRRGVAEALLIEKFKAVKIVRDGKEQLIRIADQVEPDSVPLSWDGGDSYLLRERMLLFRDPTGELYTTKADWNSIPWGEQIGMLEAGLQHQVGEQSMASKRYCRLVADEDTIAAERLNTEIAERKSVLRRLRAEIAHIDHHVPPDCRHLPPSLFSIPPYVDNDPASTAVLE